MPTKSNDAAIYDHGHCNSPYSLSSAKPEGLSKPEALSVVEEQEGYQKFRERFGLRTY